MTGTVGFEVIRKPAGHRLLRGFSCGSGTLAEGITQNIKYIYEGHAPVTVMVVTHDGEAAGVCAWYARPLPGSPTIILGDDIYVHTIGLSQRYRGRSLPDGTRLSHVLLTGSLRQVKEDSPNGRMPFSWAYTDSTNVKAHELFAQHAFRRRPPIPGHDVIWMRPAIEP